MHNIDSAPTTKSKKNKKRNKSTVTFDEEVVTKENAVKVPENEKITRENSSKHNEEKRTELRLDVERDQVNSKKHKDENKDENSSAMKKKKKSKKNKADVALDQTKNDVKESKTIKRKSSDDIHKEIEEESNEINPENPKIKVEESIRAKKRKKHAKLLEEKKLKTEANSQQLALNYLSKWKHCRNEWKFEKLRQIWLVQSLYDSSKIPNEFWETVVEYFNSSKGFIRKLVLRDALKIIDDEEKADEENSDENHVIKVQRARDMVQGLQE